MLLNGKRALITGGAQGIGREIALLFAAQGARVVIADIEDDKGFQTEKELQAFQPECFYVHTDTGDPEGLQALCDLIEARLGGLDILDNNVGINIHETVDKLTDEYLKRVWDVNLRSAFLLCKHFLPGMADRGHGHILFTSTIHSISTINAFNAYGSSKSAINAMARALAAEYGPKGIRVNVVAPGGIHSSQWEHFSEHMTDFEREMGKWSAADPLPYNGQCDDIAYGHLFFASELSAAITGQTLLVDAGSNAQLRSFDSFDYPPTFPVSLRVPYVSYRRFSKEVLPMDLYDRLGVKKYINAWDTMSMVGGSRMEPSTLAAMREASQDFVELRELEEKVGARVAEMTHNEAAYITSGASAGILLSCAVCMADGDHPEALRALPDTTGLKNQVVVMKGHRNPYDYAVKVSGATLIEAGTETACTRDQLIEALTPQTAAILYFDTHYFEPRGVPLAQVVEIAHERGIYVIVDGAAQLPPIENLWHYTRDLGADLALFSGGKGLRGPQQSGIVVGRKKLIDGFFHVAPPNQGVGRSSKAGREEIIGAYTALKAFCAPGEVERRQGFLRDASQQIIHTLNATGLFECQVIVPGPTGQTYDWVLANIKGAAFTGEALREALKADSPGVLVGAREKAITVNPLNLEPIEVDMVIRQIIRNAERLAEQ